MALRKITIDNSVKYITKIEKTQETNRKPKTIKNKSLPRKQGKSIPLNSEKFTEDFAAKGFAVLKGITKCYF